MSHHYFLLIDVCMCCSFIRDLPKYPMKLKYIYSLRLQDYETMYANIDDIFLPYD